MEAIDRVWSQLTDNLWLKILSFLNESWETAAVPAADINHENMRDVDVITVNRMAEESAMMDCPGEDLLLSLNDSWLNRISSDDHYKTLAVLPIIRRCRPQLPVAVQAVSDTPMIYYVNRVSMVKYKILLSTISNECSALVPSSGFIP